MKIASLKRTIKMKKLSLKYQIGSIIGNMPPENAQKEIISQY